MEYRDYVNKIKTNFPFVSVMVGSKWVTIRDASNGKLLIQIGMDDRYILDTNTTSFKKLSDYDKAFLWKWSYCLANTDPIDRGQKW